MRIFPTNYCANDRKTLVVCRQFPEKTPSWHTIYNFRPNHIFMKIRKLFSVYKTFYLVFVVIFIFPHTGRGQDDLEREIIHKQAQITDAINRMNDIINQADETIEQIQHRSENIKATISASITPNNRTVGVYLIIGKGNEVPPKEWEATIKKYFEAYGFPVKIILDNLPPEGKGAIALIYVGAKAYQGNLSNGSVSLHYLLTEHKKVFPDLLEMYKKSNPDLFTSKN